MKDVILSVTAVIATIALITAVGCAYNLIYGYITKKKREKAAALEAQMQHRIRSAVNAVSLEYERKMFMQERAFERKKAAAEHAAEVRAFRVCDRVFGLGGSERNRLRDNGIHM